MKKATTRLQKVNDIILFIHIIFPVWAMALIYTYSISCYVFLIALTASLLLGIIYKIVVKYKKGKLILYIARGFTILTLVAYYVPMLLLMNFTHTKILYPLKRLDYVYGVYGSSADYYEQLLPQSLPQECEDYSFRTQGSVIAQDYHASSYLMFHTDLSTIKSYADYYKNLECELYINSTDDLSVKSNIEWFCGQMRLRQYFQDNLDYAELYWFDGLYPKAVLLNYETGLVAILT